jgi:hypothetical protein
MFTEEFIPMGCILLRNVHVRISQIIYQQSQLSVFIGVVIISVSRHVSASRGTSSGEYNILLCLFYILGKTIATSTDPWEAETCRDTVTIQTDSCYCLRDSYVRILSFSSGPPGNSEMVLMLGQSSNREYGRADPLR